MASASNRASRSSGVSTRSISAGLDGDTALVELDGMLITYESTGDGRRTAVSRLSANMGTFSSTRVVRRYSQDERTDLGHHGGPQIGRGEGVGFGQPVAVVRPGQLDQPDPGRRTDDRPDL